MSGRLVGEVVDWLQTPPADGITLADAAALLAGAEAIADRHPHRAAGRAAEGATLEPTRLWKPGAKLGGDPVGAPSSFPQVNG